MLEVANLESGGGDRIREVICSRSKDRMQSVAELVLARTEDRDKIDTDRRVKFIAVRGKCQKTGSADPSQSLGVRAAQVPKNIQHLTLSFSLSLIT